MKKLFLIAAGIFLIENAQSQNVGIGTNSPLSTLHVKGNHRMGGNSSYLTHDSITGRIEWRNSNLYVPVTQALMKHSAAADGLFYNNTNPITGQLEYRNAAGEPVFYTNFTNGNGYFKNNLGIGIASPGYSLHVKSNTSDAVFVDGPENIYLTWAEDGIARGYLGSYSGNAEDIDFGTYSGNLGKIHFTTDNIPRVTIINSGNTGIGTVNPQARLHVVNGSSGYSGSHHPGAIIEGSTNTYLNFLTPAFAENGLLFGKPSDITSAGIIYNGYGVNDLQFRTGGNLSRMIIDQSGNVGIGTDGPSAKLHVLYGPSFYLAPYFPGAVIQGNADIYLSLLTPNSESGIIFGNPTNSTTGGVVYNSSGNPNGFQFRTNGNTTRMRIDQTGNVDITGRLGIGAPTPFVPLQFANEVGDKIAFSGSLGSHYGIGLANNLLFMHSNAPGSDIAFGSGGWGFFQERMRIKGNGNVGIGTTTPQSQLEVNGYTKLGSSAPKIQIKKLTGTTGATQGANMSIAHGVSAGKILSVDVLVEYGTNSFVHHSYSESAGYEFNFFFGASSITIVNVNGNSAQILSKPFRILITYEE